MSYLSTATSVATIRPDRLGVFQDMPVLDKNTRLSIVELRNSDKQIVNEMVYRWCRLLTRASPKMDTQVINDGYNDRKALIIDMLNATNPIRLAAILKRSERRMRMISIVRGTKVNSTYATLKSCLDVNVRQELNATGDNTPRDNNLKLVVIYQDEYFIIRTLDLIKDLLSSTKCQVLLVVPKLDRSEHDMLPLTSNSYQIFKTDFSISRHDIRLHAKNIENLNRIYILRTTKSCSLPKRVEGELKEQGLSWYQIPTANMVVNKRTHE